MTVCRSCWIKRSFWLRWSDICGNILFNNLGDEGKVRNRMKALKSFKSRVGFFKNGFTIEVQQREGKILDVSEVLMTMARTVSLRNLSRRMWSNSKCLGAGL